MTRDGFDRIAFHRLQELVGAVALLAAVFASAVLNSAVFASAALAADGPTAWLQVGDDPAAVLAQGGSRHRDPTEYEQFRKTQAALIKSPAVLRAAIDDPAVANLTLVRDQPEPIEWLKENLSVSFPVESEVVTVSLRAGGRKDAAKIVNAVVDSYLKNVVNVQQRDISKTFALISHEVKQNRAEIREQEAQLAKLSQQMNVESQKPELLRSRCLCLIDLSADLQKRMYDTELKLIGHRVRAGDSESSTAERVQAQRDLKIAEAQKKYLDEQQAELKQELEVVAKKVSNYQPSNADLDARREQIKAKEELTRDLEAQLQKFSLLLKMPLRVTKLMDATIPE